VYKLVYKEMISYVVAFTLISAIYRVVLGTEHRRMFEKVSLHCAKYLDLIPLSFVLGFYVTFIVQRWWSQFKTIPWPDRVMNAIILYVHGSDDRGRLIRRTLIRYMNLSFVLILSSISVAVKKRFLTLDHLVEAGFMTGEEKVMFCNVKTKVNKYWVPMCWFINLLEEARKEGRVRDGAPLKHILEEVNDLRSQCRLLWCYDWVTVPLVYTQVVTWAAHLFFIACLLGRQFLDPEQKYPGHEIDLYVPVFTFLQFFFYMGWLKVAEQLINPFGEDDDDFETNWLIDRNIQVSYLGVDDLYGVVPTMQKDIYWDESAEIDLPYTVGTLVHKIPTYRGSTMHLKLAGKKQKLVYGGGHECDRGKVNPRAGKKDKRSLWKRVSLRGTDEDEIDAVNKVRSLGRRESLLPGNLLAMWNAGRRKFASRNSLVSAGQYEANGVAMTKVSEVGKGYMSDDALASGRDHSSKSGIGSQRLDPSNRSCNLLSSPQSIRGFRDSFPEINQEDLGSAIFFRSSKNDVGRSNGSISSPLSPTPARSHSALDHSHAHHAHKKSIFDIPKLTSVSEVESEDSDSSLPLLSTSLYAVEIVPTKHRDEPQPSIADVLIETSNTEKTKQFKADSNGKNLQSDVNITTSYDSDRNNDVL